MQPFALNLPTKFCTLFIECERIIEEQIHRIRLINRHTDKSYLPISRRCFPSCCSFRRRYCWHQVRSFENTLIHKNIKMRICSFKRWLHKPIDRFQSSWPRGLEALERRIRCSHHLKLRLKQWRAGLPDFILGGSCSLGNSKIQLYVHIGF